jgi:hypothetical protein
MIFCILLLINIAGSPPVAHAKDKSTRVDNLLDRLEHKLIEQESGIDDPGLTTPSISKSPTKGMSPSHKKQSFPKAKITGSPPSINALKELDHSLTQLESEIDQFAQSVQKTSQSVIDESKVENEVHLSAQLAQPDSTVIKKMFVKIDGFKIYELTEPGGLWLPTAALSLYSGPFAPGTHRLDVELKLSKKTKDPLIVIDDVVHFVSRSFDLEVPVGRSVKRYLVKISATNQDSNPYDASLEESP